MNPHMLSLGCTLLHTVWQGSIIALLYKCADSYLEKTRSQLRYISGLAAQLSILLTAAFTFLYEEANPSPVHSTGFLSFRFLTLDMTKMLPWADGIWILGMAAMSTRALGGWWLLHRVGKATCFQVPREIRERFERMIQTLGINADVRLRILFSNTSPFAVGFFRSFVYLPLSAVSSLSPEQLDVVLAHELVHIRRADYLWNLLQTVVETLFFFHPAVWWLGREVRECREHCCDEIAVGFVAMPWIYASALLALEEQRSATSPFAMTLSKQGANSGLLRRVERILGQTSKVNPDASRWAPSVSLSLTLAACLLLVPAFMTRVTAGNQSVTRSTSPLVSLEMPSSLPSSYPLPTPASAYQSAAEDDLTLSRNTRGLAARGLDRNHHHDISAHPDPHPDPHPNPHPDPHPDIDARILAATD